MGKKKQKKAVRGAGVSITLPTEPLAGDAKTAPIMAILVQDEGRKAAIPEDEGIKNGPVHILEYEIKEGQSIQVRVGSSIKAFMERIGDAPDGDMFMDAASANTQPVRVEFEHALSGPQAFDLQPGQRLTLNPVLSRRWIMSAQDWEG